MSRGKRGGRRFVRGQRFRKSARRRSGRRLKNYAVQRGGIRL